MHDAARDGSLLALQQALDRRKFAIAKDDISPNGATALHVAVLFGHSGKSVKGGGSGQGGTVSQFCTIYVSPRSRHRALFGLTLSGDHGNYG